MALRDLGAFLDDDALDIPLGGKTYHIPSPDARTGLYLEAAMNLSAKAAAGEELSDEDAASIQLDDGEERDLYRRVLGGVFDELVADDVSWARIQRIGRYALIWFTMGPEAAERSITQGEAPAPNRKERRAAGKRSRPASSVGARKTR
jgi:hypothetical protein